MGDCETCKKERASISYVAYESALTDFRLTVKRLWIIIIILIIALVGSNAAWLWYESQFSDEVTTTRIVADQDTDMGGNNYAIGGDIYGTPES